MDWSIARKLSRLQLLFMFVVASDLMITCLLLFLPFVEEDFMHEEREETEQEEEHEQVKQEPRLLALDIIRFLGNVITKLCRDVDNLSESIKLSIEANDE